MTGSGQHDWLAERFEGHRAHLRAVACRMLGSASAAEDAVQEAWLRASRAGAAGVDNLGGWLTTIVARVCLDALRSRKSRREEPLAAREPEAPSGQDRGGAEREALLADSVGLALQVVLETLPPAERAAFVLHDMFDLSFEEIAPIVGRTAAATRQLASRARRRAQGTRGGPSAVDLARRREVVDAFLAAARGGSITGLLAVLAPEVVVRADAAAVALGAEPEIRGAAAAAQTFSRRAQAARRALLDGVAGLVWAPGGQPRVAFDFTIEAGRIVAIDLVGDPERLARLDVVLLDP